MIVVLCVVPSTALLWSERRCQSKRSIQTRVGVARSAYDEPERAANHSVASIRVAFRLRRMRGSGNCYACGWENVGGLAVIENVAMQSRRNREYPKPIVSVQ